MHFSKLAQRALGGALALLGSSLLAPPASAAWKPNSDDSLLLEARLGQFRLGDGVRGYATPDGACLDLADMIMALDIPVRLDKKLRRATGWAFEERHSIQIDRELQTVQIMNRKAALGAADILDAPEGWCVSVKRLGEWLNLELDVDQSNAVLTIKSDRQLPVQMSMERRQRAAKIRPIAQFDLAALPQARTPMRGIRPPSFDVVLGVGGIRQGRGKPRELKMSYDIYAAGEIGPVAWDARIAANRAGAPESLRLKAYRIDADGGLLGPLKATEVAAGDVSGFSTPLVAQSAAGRGGFVTNRPINQPQRYDVTDFRGELPVGWDAELYRNGELLGFAGERADGRYEFLDIPLTYGPNRFEVVLYGPQGQVRREERTVTVGADSIPPRQTWYWAGIMQEGRDLIGVSSPVISRRQGWRMTAGLERGLNTLTSIAAYGHRLVLVDGRRSSFGEISLRRALGPTLTEFSAASDLRGGMAYRGQLLGQLGRTYIDLESIVARGGFQSDRLTGNATGIHSLSIYQGIALGKNRVIPLQGEARLLTYANGIRAREAEFRSSASFGRVSLTGELKWRSQSNKQGPAPPDQLEATLLGNARIGKVRLRGESRFRLKPETRFTSLSLVGEWGGTDLSTGHRANNWRAEIAYDRPERRLRGAIGLVREFDKFAVTASLGAGTDGSVSAGLNLSFSVGPDPAKPGRFRVTSDRLASSGQLLATVFRDLNGDGIRQPGEPGERDVQLTAGRVPVEQLTDAEGRVVIDGLSPHLPLLIGVDGSSLPDPMVQPSGPGRVIRPRPAIAARVDLPLVATGEVDGTLVREDGRGIEGVDLELVDQAGTMIARTRTEYDGFFLFETVPYGQYGVRIARIPAEMLKLAPQLQAGVIVDGRRPLAKLGQIQATGLVRNAQGP